MAPELYSKSHIHGVPSDWWSVGILTYELLFKKRPYTLDELKSLQNSSTISSQGKMVFA